MAFQSASKAASIALLKTSGGARWNYLAAWGYAEKFGGDQAKVKAFVTTLYRNVPVLDSGARGSTTTFAQRGIGDVLIAWENEAFLALQELGADKFQIIVPSISIKAVPPVALVDANVDEKGTRKVAEAYLQFLYSDAGQKIIAHNFYRPASRRRPIPRTSSASPTSSSSVDDDVRRLGEGAAGALRRRWRLRPNLQAVE